MPWRSRLRVKVLESLSKELSKELSEEMLSKTDNKESFTKSSRMMAKPWMFETDNSARISLNSNTRRWNQRWIRQESPSRDREHSGPSDQTVVVNCKPSFRKRPSRSCNVGALTSRIPGVYYTKATTNEPPPQKKKKKST